MIQTDYLTRDAYNTYVTYLAVKRHFTSSYDFFKYNGKVKVSFDSFSERRDAYQFYQLSKKKDPLHRIVSTVIKSDKAWIGDILSQEGEEQYLSWKKKQDAITHHFEESLEILDDIYQENFIIRNGQHPLIVSTLLQKKISFESFSILVKLSNVASYWEKESNDNMLLPDIIRKAVKYEPFLEYSTKKFNEILKIRFF